MIEIQNVSKAYSKDKKVIDGLDLQIRNGEIFGFLGPNGAGKTTTIKMITGITKIDSGDILIDGKSITSEPIEAKKSFGLVPDNPDIFIKLKGMEYLNFLADIYEVDSAARKEHIEKWAKEFGIYENLNDRIQSYSHGMRQKIVLIGATLHNPNNIILDEPMVGLDPKSSHMLKDMMKDYSNNGKTVFFSTHVLEVAEKICDRIGIINNGKLLFVGTIDELKIQMKEEKSLEDMFLEIVEE